MIENDVLKELMEHMEDVIGELDDLKEHVSDIMFDMEEEASEAEDDDADGSELYSRLRSTYDSIENSYLELNGIFEDLDNFCEH